MHEEVQIDEVEGTMYEKYMEDNYVYIVSTSNLCEYGIETDVVLITRDFKLAQETADRLVQTNYDNPVWCNLNRAML